MNSNRIAGRRALHFGVSIVVVAAVAMAPAVDAASSVNQRLDRLESQVHEILHILKGRQRGGVPGLGSKVTPAPSPKAGPARTPQPVSPPPNLERGTRIQYFISRVELQTPQGVDPQATGIIEEVARLKFTPSRYGVKGGGIFSHFRDPSEYRSVALLVQGQYHARRSGTYVFYIYPKPARGGRDMSLVSTAMSGTLAIGGRTLIRFPRTSSWAPRHAGIHLQAGMHRFRLWVVDYSAGYGPSPISSLVDLAVQRPGDAGPQPLKTLYVSR
ncbi:MAG TPA: hypothetical protein ENH08_04170 [Chromatiales bacterium]|nr:hypothetical protein [Chromatiales bacterium]